MNILFPIAEAAPFVQIGGLGEIGGSLPKFINNTNKTKVRVIMPKYRSIPDCYHEQMKQRISFEMQLSWRRINCIVEEMEWEGVHYYFVSNDYYFERDNVYDYVDDGERFAFFCKAVLESLPYLDFQPDIIHCHDWHTALIPFLLQEHYKHEPYYFEMKSILTIHNLKHQGHVPLTYFDDVLGYHSENKGAWHKLEYYGQLNYLKAGLLSADRITTVSPTYAQEIQDPYYGEGLDGILRQRSYDLIGILNGIDTQKYNPETDPMIFENYRSSLEKKAKNKCNLQEFLKLPINAEVPLMCIVSRLVEQKGFDLLNHIFEELLSMDVQVVVLGTGQSKYEQKLRELAERYPHKLAIRLYFNEELAHKIYAASDILIMPSQFEPCGLSQMIAMNYGTLPIVRETGGLRDSVVPYNEEKGEGNGFSFANYNAHELLFTVQRAVKIYYEQKDIWKNLVNNALKSDFNWKKSAIQYLNLYKSLLLK